MSEPLDPLPGTKLPPAVAMKGDAPEVSLSEVGGMISRATGLPPEARGLSDFAGVVHASIRGNPQLLQQARNGDITPYILSMVPPELANTMDAGKRAAAEQAAKANGGVLPVSGFVGGLGGAMSRFGPDQRGGNHSASGEGGSSGARYDKIGNGGIQDWSTAAGLGFMRGFAMQKGLPWATKEPDLLRLGPDAIKALADVHLKQDGYKHWKDDIGLNNPDIVAGAHYMKDEGGDYNKAAKAAADVQKELTPGEGQEHKKAINELFNTKPGEARDRAKKKLFDADEQLKKAHPSLDGKIDEERQQLQILNDERQHKLLKLQTQQPETQKKELRAQQQASYAKEHEIQAQKKIVGASSLKGDILRLSSPP